jgi:hypothetical protein
LGTAIGINRIAKNCLPIVENRFCAVFFAWKRFITIYTKEQKAANSRLRNAKTDKKTNNADRYNHLSINITSLKKAALEMDCRVF